MEQFDAKHESSLVYEGGTLSYDPGVYGGNFQDRYHIKTLKVTRRAGLLIHSNPPVLDCDHVPRLDKTVMKAI